MDGVTVTIDLNGVLVPLTLDADAVAAIAAALPEHESSPWLYEAQAAAGYLGWSRERVYKSLHRLPHYRDEGRLMFNRDELTHYVEVCRER
jgi:hypothetical protein